MVNEQSHYDILLMYLMKKHHGVQGVLNVLAEKHRKLWEPLICLKTIKEKLKVCTAECIDIQTTYAGLKTKGEYYTFS